MPRILGTPKGGSGCGCCGGCTCNSGVCVQTCAGTAILGATVTVSSLTPVTTSTGGCASVCLDSLGGAGSYLVTVSKTGYITYSNTRAMTCGGTIFVSLLPVGSTPTATFTITGCCSLLLPNALVTIAGNVYTTNSSGQVVIGITDPGTYTWFVAKTRFMTQTGTLTVSTCLGAGAVFNLTLLPISGYHCAPAKTHPSTVTIADPVSDTLFVTDALGTTTLAYDAGTADWLGSITISLPARCFCQARNVKVNYTYGPSCTNGLSYASAALLIDPACACECPCDPVSDPVHCTNTAAHAVGPLGTVTETLSLTVPLNYSISSTATTCVNGSTFIYDILFPGGYSGTVTE